jgi:hypothetical protein
MQEGSGGVLTKISLVIFQDITAINQAYFLNLPHVITLSIALNYTFDRNKSVNFIIIARIVKCFTKLTVDRL